MRSVVVCVLTLLSASGCKIQGYPHSPADSGTYDAGHDAGQDSDVADSGYDAGFDAGQDAGPRFIASAGGSVTDSSTGLVWEQDAGGSYTQSTAAMHCTGLTFDGASNWRLPTKDELVAISGVGFPTVYGGTFWTTSLGPTVNTWWYVTFTTGAASSAGGSLTFGARCVR